MAYQNAKPLSTPIAAYSYLPTPHISHVEDNQNKDHDDFEIIDAPFPKTMSRLEAIAQTVDVETQERCLQESSQKKFRWLKTQTTNYPYKVLKRTAETLPLLKNLTRLKEAQITKILNETTENHREFIQSPEQLMSTLVCLREKCDLSKSIVFIEKNEQNKQYILVIKDTASKTNYVIGEANIPIQNSDSQAPRQLTSLYPSTQSTTSPSSKTVSPAQSATKKHDFSSLQQQALLVLQQRLPRHFNSEEQIEALHKSGVLRNRDDDLRLLINKETSNDILDYITYMIHGILSRHIENQENATALPESKPSVTRTPKLPTKPYIEPSTPVLQTTSTQAPLTQRQLNAFQVLKRYQPWITDEHMTIIADKNFLSAQLVSMLLGQSCPFELNYIKTPDDAAQSIARSLRLQMFSKQIPRFTYIGNEESVAYLNKAFKHHVMAQSSLSESEFTQCFSTVQNGKYTEQALINAAINFKKLQPLYQEVQGYPLDPQDFGILLAEDLLATDPRDETLRLAHTLYYSADTLQSQIKDITFDQFCEQMDIKEQARRWVVSALERIGKYRNILNGTLRVHEVSHITPPQRNGLYNWGNNCFVNVAIQSFAHSLLTNSDIYHAANNLTFHSAYELLDRFMRRNCAPIPVKGSKEYENYQTMLHELARDAENQVAYNENPLTEYPLQYHGETFYTQEYFYAFFTLRNNLIHLCNTLNHSVSADQVIVPHQLQVCFFESLNYFAQLTNNTAMTAMLGSAKGMPFILSEMVQADPHEFLIVLLELLGIDKSEHANLNITTEFNFWVDDEQQPRERRRDPDTLHTMLPIATLAESSPFLATHISHHFENEEMVGNEKIRCEAIKRASPELPDDAIHTYKQHIIKVNSVGIPPETCSISPRLYTQFRAKIKVTNPWKNSKNYEKPIDLGAVMLGCTLRQNQVVLPFESSQGDYFNEVYELTHAFCHVGTSQDGGHYVTIIVPKNATIDTITVCDDTVCLSLRYYAISKNVPINNEEVIDACEALGLSAYAYFLKRKNHDNNVYALPPAQVETVNVHSHKDPFSSLKTYNDGQEFKDPYTEFDPTIEHSAPAPNPDDLPEPISFGYEAKKDTQDSLSHPQHQSHKSLRMGRITADIQQPQSSALNDGHKLSNVKPSQANETKQASPAVQPLATQKNNDNAQPEIWRPSTELSPLVVRRNHRYFGDVITESITALPETSKSKSKPNKPSIGSKINTTQYLTPDPQDTDQRPFDPNLICMSCNTQFRIGEIQIYARHANKCNKNIK
ncbi:hypothetical protein D5R81_10345 [Parashewanella spongiae]|uniref:ubiquitinyl hydrolase 1 n=1 Tax=Parashewanella spongiae TaxID=342950 RepID=A0A3A6TU00_9GAMM|nr:ubiquitin carboxyl-terminal hydrolase family protein [Parashewanella spongiae]MCL1079571.1 ubiquitin carboxyl-terminal hydrolase [Parashewanella spongiae]RJY14956.1 hypothetical protein D5R81_10345 [Parashewanella spongiae]